MAEAHQAAVRTILLSSPPGQFDIILEDLQSLLPKSSATTLLEASLIADVRSEWEKNTGRSSLAAADGDRADDGDACIAALSKALDAYVALKFSSPGVRAAHDVTASTVGGAPTLAMATYAERVDLHNHHAGSWKGEYTIDPSTGSLSGSVSVLAHTFENGGNVQLRSNVAFDDINVGAFPSSGEGEKQSSWAKGVARQIESWEEKEVMDHMTGMFESMGNTYLKSLRRVMPITRTKMEWNVMAHRVRQTLGEGHDKEKFKH